MIGIVFEAIRHLNIPGPDELGRLPEVNYLNMVCARELSTLLSAVLISSRTSFRLTSRRIVNVSILRLFCVLVILTGKIIRFTVLLIVV